MGDMEAAGSYDEFEDGLVAEFPSAEADRSETGMSRRLSSDVFPSEVLAATPTGSSIKMTGSEKNVNYLNCSFETHHYDNPQHDSTDAEMTQLLDGKFTLFKHRPLHPEAQVYHGCQTLSSESRDVAIKLIPIQDDREKELQLHKNLHHSNIVQLFDCDFIVGPINFTFVVMELCGHNLEEYVTTNQSNPLEFQKCSPYSKHILKGLAYLQKQNIVHRDLRPSNILLTLDGATAKITDFKFARDLSKADYPAKTRRICEGTNGYRAAELLKPNNPTGGFPADVFSYGLVVCYMFSKGRHPFGSNRYMWAGRILEGKTPEWNIIPQSVPRWSSLISLLAGCLKHQPRDRYTVEKLLKLPFFTQTPSSGRRNSSKDRETNPKTPRSTPSKTSQSCSAIADLDARERTNPKRIPPRVRSSSAIPLPTPSPNRKSRKELYSASCPDSEVSARGSEIKRSLRKSFSYLGLGEIAGRVDELEQLGDHDNLDTALQMTGCELHLRRDREEASMQRVRDLLPSSRSALSIRLQADDYSIGKRYSSALVLYRISTERFLKQDNSPDDVAEWIKRIADGISEACVRLSYEGSTSQGVAVEYGAQYLEKLLIILRSMTNLDPNILSVTGAFCQKQINKIYRQSADPDHNAQSTSGSEPRPSHPD